MSKDKKKSCYASVGGQALMDGILMNAPGQSAFVVRLPNGSTFVEKKRVAPQKKGFATLPLVRGIVNFVKSMIIGYKALSRSIDLTMPLEEEGETLTEKQKKKNDALTGFAVVLGSVLGVVAAVFLMIWLPSFLVKLLRSLVEVNGYVMPYWLVSLIEGLVKIIIFMVYISLCTLNKDIKRVFMYHGAEHKTIFCYEHKLPLTVENVKMQKRFHPRCGTSFIVIMIAVSVFVGAFIRFDNVWIRAAFKLLLLPLVLGIGYELLKLCGKYDNVFTRILAAPGLWFQRLTTKEPNDDRILEIGIASLEAALDLPFTVPMGAPDAGEQSEPSAEIPTETPVETPTETPNNDDQTQR